MSPVICLLFAVLQVAYGCYGGCGGQVGCGDNHCGQPSFGHSCHIEEPLDCRSCFPKPVDISVRPAPPVQYVHVVPQQESCPQPQIFAAPPPAIQAPPSNCFGAPHFGQPAEPIFIPAPAPASHIESPCGGSPVYGIADNCGPQMVSNHALPVHITQPAHPPHCSPAPAHCDLGSHCHAGKFAHYPVHSPCQDECGSLCAKHYIVKHVCPVYDEYIRNVPVVKNFIRQEPVITVKTITAIKRKITMKPEPCGHHGSGCSSCNCCKPRQVYHTGGPSCGYCPPRDVCHTGGPSCGYCPPRDVCHTGGPMCGSCRPSNGCHKATRVIPVRIVHVPAPEKKCKCCTSHTPRVCMKLKPVVQDTLIKIPVQHKSYRPVVEQRVVYIPVKTKVRKDLIEHRVEKACCPCECI